MSKAGAKRAGRRFYRRPAFLVALGIASTLGATCALAAVAVKNGHSSSAPAPALSIRTEPLSRTVAPGGSAQFAVRVMRRHRVGAVGLSGRTDLSVGRELPVGAGASFTPQRSLASPGASPRISTLTLTTAADTPAGAYMLRVQAHRPHRAGATTISLTVSSPANPAAAAVPKPTTPTVPVRAPDAFTISGTLPDPLTPGAGEPLDLSLANRQSTDLSISSLSVQVASVSGPESDPTHPCSANDFSVARFSGASGFTLASLAVPHKHRSARALKVSLGERQGLADPKAGAPEHDDQTAKAQSGWALSCLAHHGDDLLHPGRVGWVAAALVAGRAARVVAGERGWRTPTTGGVQLHRGVHGSPPWFALNREETVGLES